MEDLRVLVSKKKKNKGKERVTSKFVGGFFKIKKILKLKTDCIDWRKKWNWDKVHSETKLQRSSATSEG